MLDFMILSILVNSFLLIPDAEHWGCTQLLHLLQLIQSIFRLCVFLFETTEEFLVDSLHICSIHNYNPLYYRCYIFSFWVQCMVKYKTDVIYFISAVYMVMTLALLWFNLNFHLVLAILYNLMINDTMMVVELHLIYVWCWPLHQATFRHHWCCF